MKSEMYSLFDEKLGSFQPPFAGSSRGVVLRGLQSSLNEGDKQNDFQKYPSDFKLYLVGHYDHDQGTIEPVTPPELLFRLSDLVVSQ